MIIFPFYGMCEHLYTVCLEEKPFRTAYRTILNTNSSRMNKY